MEDNNMDNKSIEAEEQKQQDKQELLRNAFIELFEAYGEDYTNDGTMGYIIGQLKENNVELLHEISNVVDRDWIQRTQEMGKCRLFTEIREYSEGTHRLTEPVLQSNYMDSLNKGDIIKNIPTLRFLSPRMLSYKNDEGR